MQDTGLREIKRVLLLPSMWGMAMRHDQEFHPCHWCAGDDADDSHMASEGG
jgi:hypothetical protein